jgi:hypothetical protein
MKSKYVNNDIILQKLIQSLTPQQRRRILAAAIQEERNFLQATITNLLFRLDGKKTQGTDAYTNIEAFKQRVHSLDRYERELIDFSQPTPPEPIPTA